MATEITDSRILGQLNLGGGQAAGSPSIIVGKPEDRPTPQTRTQAAKDVQEVEFGAVSPTIALSNAYKADKTVQVYEASMPIYIAALRSKPNTMGDRNLVTYAAKLTDPTTGVLNGEREGYSEAAAIADRVKTFLDKQLSGGGELNAQQRQFIRNELTQLLLARNAGYNLVRQDAAARAKNLNVNPANVIGTHAGKPYKTLLKAYDAEMGVADQKTVAPAAGPETGAAKSYRFTPEREKELIDYVGSGKFTPTGYADLVAQAATEVGVNVDDKYREMSLAEGNRILNAKKEGRPIAGAISYQKADASYEKQLDEYNKQRAKMEGETIRTSLFGQESPYAQRFAAGTGLADEASGLGAGLGAVLQGREFSPAYQMARDAATRRIQLLREQQSGLSGVLGMGSELLGGVGVSAAPAGALSRARTLSQLSPTARILLGETATGAGLGAAEAAPGQRLRGAIVGGAVSPAFAATGAVGQRAANRIIQGLPADVAPMSRQLMNEGIVPTPGQIGQETGGRFGREVALREQAATSVPILGPAISARRNEGIMAGNLAAGKRSVSTIGGEGRVTETGLAMREQLDQVVGDAYDAALQPMQLVTDTQFKQAQRKINAKLGKISGNDPEAVRSVKNIWRDNVAPFIDSNGQISGENLQAIKRSIQAERSKIEQMPGSKGATDIIDGIEGALFDGLAKRQAPSLYDAYRAADKAYRESRIVTNAVTAAETKAGSPGIFTPSGLAGKVRQSEAKYGPSDIGGSGGLSEAMTTVLPATLSESGTAPRAGMLSLFGGAGGTGGALGSLVGNPVMGAILGLGTAGVASLPYSKLGNKLIAKTLLGKRPAPITALGDYLSKNPQLGRSVGMAAGLDYMTPQESFSGRPALLTPEQQALINVYAGGR